MHILIGVMLTSAYGSAVLMVYHGMSGCTLRLGVALFTHAHLVCNRLVFGGIEQVHLWPRERIRGYRPEGVPALCALIYFTMC